MYHQIGQPGPKGTPYRGLTVHPADFRRQMAWLRRFGYRGLSMRDLLPYVRGERLGKVVGITFDDGYRNVYQNALPVLNEQNFTATNYFVVRQLDGGNVWDYQKGVAHSDLMSADEMRAWAAAGMEVGSHTLDHPFLPKLSPDIAAFQIRQSKQELEDILGVDVTAFCYPYGGQSPEIRAMVQDAGYTNATTTERGLVRTSDDVYGLPRVTVARSTNIIRFLQKCMTRLEDRRRKA
ncbi:polysaccharide deacetylase family protein [Pollutimonas harenae]|uniref:Polysaccharide deacetylase family protein n=1 Tax=Pollutimonas harenae TaxID=657015 RepID=A0A853GWW1_9BURK|nr:polysaccharide deacetylase family protein [Pollutimonas harenae]NYT86637.1 polysaccharide deacetylase family protein [Pollutimonas harenae]TEA69625.1 polysaccharide deacetylase family protein [Pollutimonas harenae]